jgi:hypothetical protein
MRSKEIRMSDAIPLPPRPNLEQYQKLARELQDDCKSGNRAAIRHWASRWVETLARLNGAAIGATPRVYQRTAEAIPERWDKLKEARHPALLVSRGSHERTSDPDNRRVLQSDGQRAGHSDGKDLRNAEKLES